MTEYVETDDGLFGERPVRSTPIPNQADAAFERKRELLAQARDLGLDVPAWTPLRELEQAVAAAVREQSADG